MSQTVKPIAESEVSALDVVRRLEPWRKQLATHFGTRHGNASLELIDVVTVLTAAFFNPLVRSQRLIEALSQQEWMRDKLPVQRIPRATLSDALRRFDPQVLHPVMEDLARRIPGLAYRHEDLADVTRQVIAADGSYFNLMGEVAWALANRRGHSDQPQSRVRLNLQLDVQRFIPVDFDISGRDQASEAAAVAQKLKPDVIYLVDRNFVHFGFIRAVLEKGASLVLRLRKDVGFQVQSTRELSARDKENNVQSDELGVLTGPVSKGNEGRPTRTAKAPEQTLRRVVVWDEVKKESVLLLTDLVDVPAYVIALLYRRRWQIELFFRWLKCWGKLDHLLSQSPQGITLQFYVAVIATLLLHLSTGRKASKYTLFWLASVASGQATWEQMQDSLARLEREKCLDQARRKRKKLAVSNSL